MRKNLKDMKIIVDFDEHANKQFEKVWKCINNNRLDYAVIDNGKVIDTKRYTDVTEAFKMRYEEMEDEEE